MYKRQILGYSIAATVVFTYVGLFGEYAVAGYGSATRIEQVVLEKKMKKTF